MTLRKFSFFSAFFVFFSHENIKGSPKSKGNHFLENLTLESMEEKSAIALNIECNFEKDLFLIQEKIKKIEEENQNIQKYNFNFQDFFYFFLNSFEVIEDQKKRKHLFIAFMNFVNDSIINSFEERKNIKNFEIYLLNDFIKKIAEKIKIMTSLHGLSVFSFKSSMKKDHDAKVIILTVNFGACSTVVRAHA